MFYVAPLALIALVLAWSTRVVAPRRRVVVAAAVVAARAAGRRSRSTGSSTRARGLRHVRAAAVVVAARPLDLALTQVRCGGARRRGRGGGAVPARCRGARARAARRSSSARASSLDHGVVAERPARDPHRLGRRALRRDPRRAPRLDRPRRRADDADVSRALERAARPAHRSGRTSSSTAASAASTTWTARSPGGLPETPVTRSSERRARRRCGPRRAARSTCSPTRRRSARARRSARDPRIGLYLVRVERAAVVLDRRARPGIDPATPGRGKTVTYRRARVHRRPARRCCCGATRSSSRATRSSTATSPARRAGAARVPPDRRAPPRRRRSSAARRRRARVRFDVATTLVPADVVPGSTDTRPLGVHFLRFDYRP